MNVIFLTDLLKEKIHKDDIRDVSDGYARNFLFPRKLAAPATHAAVAAAQQRGVKVGKEKQRKVDQMRALVEKLKGLTIALRAKAYEGKLYGGINAATIAAAVQKQGVAIDDGQIRLEHPIKLVGFHKVYVHLGEGFEAEVTVRVEAEE